MNNRGAIQTRNLMWIDIAKSHLRMKEMGITAYAEKLEDYYRIIDIITSNYSVKMVDSLGDGISINSSSDSIDSLISVFFAIKNEVKTYLDLDVKAGMHRGKIFAKDVNLSNGIRIPLVAGAINEAFRLESLCGENNTYLLLSPNAYKHIHSAEIKSQFVLNKGQYKRKSSVFSRVYRYIKYI